MKVKCYAETISCLAFTSTTQEDELYSQTPGHQAKALSNRNSYENNLSDNASNSVR